MVKFSDLPKKIYHITHLNNLRSICQAGRLWSDSARGDNGVVNTNIGYLHIKKRRLQREVPVAARGLLGDYVPFYFCNRSIMLYVLWQGHQNYRGGQTPIVHLVSDIDTVIDTGREWCFTDRHAELGYANYYEKKEDLQQVDWSVMPLEYWAGCEDIKERRQAEFLVHKCLPWTAIKKIGVHNETVKKQVEDILSTCAHRPLVVSKPSWYY